MCVHIVDILGARVAAPMSDDSPQNQIQVIGRAAKILRALRDAPATGLPLSQLAAEVGLPRTTAHRIVQSLAVEGFVINSPDERNVHLGPELGRLAVATQTDFDQVCHALMEDLARQIGETVDLAVLQGLDIRFVDHVPAQQRLRLGTVIGDVFPAYCTANGKALLAAMPREFVTAALPAQLPALTPHTITDRDELVRELDEVRELGYAFDREEQSERICAVGVLVRDRSGARASLTIAAPAERFYPREDELVEAILRQRDRIGEALGTSGAIVAPA
jgi:DNA-binding IclR family transcriptional regulator